MIMGPVLLTLLLKYHIFQADRLDFVSDAARAMCLSFHHLIDRISIILDWHMVYGTVSTRISAHAIHFGFEAPSERTYLYKTTQNALCTNFYTSSQTFPSGALLPDTWVL